MAVGPLAPIDRATLAYAAVALAFNLARGPRAWPSVVLLPFGLLAVGLYTHVGLVNAAGGASHDALVQGWEAALFGGQPSIEWIRAFASPGWSTLMHGAYLSYYVILVAAPLGLWLAGRRPAARQTLLRVMVAFYACYTAFLAFPVAGPRYLFPPAANAATAVPLAVLTHRLLEGGSAWGTAFPSSHVAAALVASVSAWRGWRPLGAVLVPAAVLLSFATVYGQLHYAVDAVAGAVVAAIVIGWRWTGYDSPPGVPDAGITTPGDLPP